MVGTHLIKAWSSTQPNIALSSGEAEVVGVTKACATSLGYRSLLADLGLSLSGRVWTDSSAAIGICKRQGLGKLRHLDTQMLWVQQRVRNNDLDLYYVPGEKNPADVFTKPNIPQSRMDSLLSSMGCEYQEGRPESAPELRREGGTKTFALSDPAPASAHASMVRSNLQHVGIGARWADMEDSAMSLSLHDILLRGLPHGRGVSAVLSVHCDNILPEDVDDPDELVKWQVEELPHETEAVNWKLSQELPPQQDEREEPVDDMTEQGMVYGREGNGKAPLPSFI